MPPNTSPDFTTIAVIGAGTMGAGIAAHIANAGQKVLLLDIATKGNPNARATAAIERLLKTDPPALMDKTCADNITIGNIDDDFHRLADCDWVIEAIVERLDLKRALYSRLNQTINANCVVTSNTSSIPISLLTEDMPAEFRNRFAITHYFNPVRYMRLLELVRGTDTAPEVMARLARYNDQILGKGVVTCRDTPGFLGNRVGVFALQVGMDEAVRAGLDIETADALFGRPLGIPKTGIFGLYDMIGVDLMADVVDTLDTILPQNDDFKAVAWGQNPLTDLIKTMIAKGFTGDKGKGGFYRDGQALDLTTGATRPRKTATSPRITRAMADLQAGREPLHGLINTTDADAESAFIRRLLARILAYSASLIPDVTTSPQDIDDAMKLGFNWVRGPFELMDAIGAGQLRQMITEAGLDIPPVLASHDKFYKPADGVLTVRVFPDKQGETPTYTPVSLPKQVVRFHMLRQCLQPIAQNASASLFALDGDLRLLEFHSKANALNAESMAIVRHAAKDHGAGILVHNDAQHFSAGVDLNAFRAYMDAGDWTGIDGFLQDFQNAVMGLASCPVPVVGAPSGLAIGGGFEVLCHCDELIVHSNSVLGLVEAAVGLVPAGGGVKETLYRWYLATNDWEKAAWQTWMQVGYAQTGSSPALAARYQYYLPSRDKSVMNRDRLVAAGVARLRELADGYQARAAAQFVLPARGLADKMAGFMDDGIDKGWFFPHDKVVAMQVASIVVNMDGESLEVSGADMYARERAAFVRLAQMEATQARIAAMLDDGVSLRN